VLLRRFSKEKTHTKFVTLIFCSFVGQIHASNLDFTTTLKTTGYVYETEIAENEATTNEAIVIEPSILASYSNRRFSLSFAADHTIVEQKEELEGADKDFTEFKYNGNLTLIENALFFSANGTQKFRVVNQQQDYVSDKIFAAGDLTEFRNNAATLNFSIPNPKHMGLSIQSTYSETDTEASLGGLGGINGDNTAIAATIYQGNSAENYRFDISGQFNDTSRTNFQDFKSTTVRGTLAFSIAPKYEIVFVGSSEDYDVDLEGLSRRTSLDSTSYGAGLEWSPMPERSATLTYNQLDEGENTTNFVGLNLDWALSSRTALVFDYGKRFYGDAYSFNFSHALKHVRSSMTYSEQVTSFSRLGNNPTGATGLFVCQFGSTDLSDCFQPQNTDYELQAGEEFRTLAEIETDINEEVIFRKSGSFNLSYDKRRVKASIGASYGTTEYLESNRIQKNRSIRGSLSYELGRKSELSMSANIARNQFNEISEPDTIATYSVDFKRDIGQNLKFTVGARLLDRESDDEGRNIVDKRLSVGLNYKF
jgi:uncharacterized protein (PEP-CTERM system associated)